MSLMPITLKKITPKAMARALVASVATVALLVSANSYAAIPIEHWTLANGAQVYLIQSPSIPMLDVNIDFDAGSRRDPAGQAGLAGMTASMIDKGMRAGSGSAEPAMDENALGEAWADLGARFGAGASSDRMSFSLRTLTDPPLLDKAVALAARELAMPSFPDAIWQRERQRLQAALKEAYTKPGNVAGRAYSQAVYGKHPYGAEVTDATLARISVADMAADHAAGVVACRARVSMVGAVTRAQAEVIATRLLARLPQVACASLPPLPSVPEVAALTAPKEERIPFASAQAHVLMGQPGYKRTDPDHLALYVGNYILGGGGFVSRLTEEVREKLGLVYGISSSFSPSRHAGAFTIGFQTRPDQADKALVVARQVLADFVANGPTEAELQAAKDNLIGGFALGLDSNAELLGNLSGIAWNDLPLDYLDTWTQKLEKITVTDVKAAFQRKLQPNRMVTIVLGAAS